MGEEILSATEARKNFSELLDKANSKPVAMKRRKNIYYIFNGKQLLNSVPFTIEVNKEDKEAFAFFKEIPEAYGVGKTMEDVAKDLTVALVGYTELFMKRYDQSMADPIQKERLLQVTVLNGMKEDEIEVFVRAKLEGFRKIS